MISHFTHRSDVHLCHGGTHLCVYEVDPRCRRRRKMKYNIKRAFNAAQYIKQETREKLN